jgi:ABC-type transporter Mla subunit MlaD
MAKVDDLKGCVMLEDMRASKLEGEIRRSAEMLKIFEQQVAGTIATEVLSSLEQFTLSYDRQLKEIRQVIDGVNTLQCETARNVGEVSKTVGEVSKTVDGVAMVSMGTRSQSDAHASTLTQLRKRIDQQLLHQQQQVEMNEVFLELGDRLRGKDAQVDRGSSW